jgi:hypothetical protein
MASMALRTVVWLRIFIETTPGSKPVYRKTPYASPTLTMQHTELPAVLTPLRGDKFHRRASGAASAEVRCEQL